MPQPISADRPKAVTFAQTACVIPVIARPRLPEATDALHRKGVHRPILKLRSGKLALYVSSRSHSAQALRHLRAFSGPPDTLFWRPA